MLSAFLRPRLAWGGLVRTNSVNAVVNVVTDYKGKFTQPTSDVPFDRVRPIQHSFFRYGGYRPSCFAPNTHNQIEALKMRVLKKTPVVDIELMTEFCTWVKVNYRHLFPQFRKRRSVPIDVYLKNSNASPSVKRNVMEAFTKLREQGIDENSNLTRNELYKYTLRKSFVKVENNLYSSPQCDLHDKAPRLIQGATPEFIALVGPAFMSIQAEIKRVWSRNHMVWFTSGASTKDTADYITKDRSWRIFENDVSAWDASMHELLGELEVWLAAKMGARPAVIQLMRANIDTHGVTNSGIRYSVKGTRKSGDPYTSCFNSVINGLMHLFCIFKGGVSIEDLCRVVKMLVQGDDNAMRHSPFINPDWSLIYRLGFRADNIYRKSELELEFCSSRLYPVDDGKDGYCFGPKIGKLLNKFLCFINPPLNVHPCSVARGVAMGLQLVATYVPLIANLVDRVLWLTRGHSVYYDRQQDWKMTLVGQKNGFGAHNIYDG